MNGPTEPLPWNPSGEIADSMYRWVMPSRAAASATELGSDGAMPSVSHIPLPWTGFQIGTPLILSVDGFGVMNRIADPATHEPLTRYWTIPDAVCRQADTGTMVPARIRLVPTLIGAVTTPRTASGCAADAWTR